MFEKEIEEETKGKCPIANGKKCIFEDFCDKYYNLSPCWGEQHGP